MKLIVALFELVQGIGLMFTRISLSSVPSMYLIQRCLSNKSGGVVLCESPSIKSENKCFILDSAEPHTGSRSTFEFPSQVNFFGPSLYCIALSLGK